MLKYIPIPGGVVGIDGGVVTAGVVVIGGVWADPVPVITPLVGSVPPDDTTGPVEAGTVGAEPPLAEAVGAELPDGRPVGTEAPEIPDVDVDVDPLIGATETPVIEVTD